MLNKSLTKCKFQGSRVWEAGAPPSPATHHLGNLGTFTQLFEPQFSQLYTGKKDPSIAGDSDVDT